MRFCLAVYLVAMSALRAQDSPLPTSPGGAPRIQISTRVWDFGQMWFGEACESDIEIKNVGGAVLQFMDVKSTCGCTVARPQKQALAPGESDRLHLSYNTRKGAKSVRQSVTIMTNDPAEPSVTIEVKGEVRNVFECEPGERVSFGQLTPNARVSQSVSLRNNLEQPLTPRLRPLEPQQPFEVTLQEISAGRDYKLTVTTRPPLLAGMNSANIVLETDSERFPTMTIPVTAYSSESVSVTPPQLVLSANATAPQTRTIRVNYLPDRPLKIVSAKSVTPGVQVQVLPATPTPPTNGMFAFHQLRATLPAFENLPASGAEIVIETDAVEDKFKRFVIPVRRFTAASGPTTQPAPSGVATETPIRRVASQPHGGPD